MTEKSVQEIKAQHGAKEAEILTADYDARQETRELREPEQGAYLDRLSAGQRMSLLREQKAEREEERYRRTTEAMTAESNRYQAELSERAGFLKERLFAVQDANTVASLPSATEEQLGDLLDFAILTGNKDAARAAFVGAHMRNLGDLMARYFHEVDPEARALYQEWAEIPPAEVLKRQRENISGVVQSPDPDSLMPPARVNV
jgi:hypothetical protein